MFKKTDINHKKADFLSIKFLIYFTKFIYGERHEKRKSCQYIR